MSFMIYLERDEIESGRQYNLSVKTKSYLIPLVPSNWTDLHVWISPVTHSGRFICEILERGGSKLCYEYRALTLQNLWGSYDVASLPEISSAVCRARLELVNHDTYPTLDLESGAIIEEVEKGGKRKAILYQF